MEPGRIIENIKDHAARGMFSFCGYELSKNEAETVVTALAEYIENHKEEKHGEKTHESTRKTSRGNRSLTTLS